MESQVGTMVAASSRAQPTAGSLVARAAQGDADAFDTIARDAGDLLYRRALRILRNPADAQDATQAALIKAWRELPRLGDVGRFDAWLDRILVNTCRDHLRSRGRRMSRELPAAYGSEDPARAGLRTPGPDDDSTRRIAIEAALGRLGIEDRALLVLHHVEQRPLRQIGDALGIPVGTVKWRLHRARARLERQLQKEEVR